MTFSSGTNRVSYDNYLFSFGKYQGHFVYTVFAEDPEYILWLLDQPNLDPELKRAIDYNMGKFVSEEKEKDDAKRMSNRRKNKKHISKNRKTVQKKRRVGPPCNSRGIVLPSELY